MDLLRRSLHIAPIFGSGSSGRTHPVLLVEGCYVAEVSHEVGKDDKTIFLPG